VSNEIEWQAGQTVTLSGFATATSGRNITKQRIYRLQSSIATGADLFFIAERNDTASNYVDSSAVDDFSEVLPSRDWNHPPDTLEGLVSLPNGMMAAFVGKDLYFCEPYRPHAWPQKYVLTIDYNIVALGAYGTTIVVMTEGTSLHRGRHGPGTDATGAHGDQRAVHQRARRGRSGLRSGLSDDGWSCALRQTASCRSRPKG
jgi:hypothetical protein